jgi:hypothetical protein
MMGLMQPTNRDAGRVMRAGVLPRARDCVIA